MKLIQQLFFIFLITLNAQVHPSAENLSIHPSPDELRLMQQQAKLDAIIIRLLKKASQRPDMAICRHIDDSSGYGKISTEIIVESGNFIIEQQIPIVLQILKVHNATSFGVAYDLKEHEVALTIVSRDELKNVNSERKPLINMSKPLMRG